MFELNGFGKALIVTLLFRSLFGGYIMSMDQYRFNDTSSALTVLLIYGLIIVLGSLFLFGSRRALLGMVVLDAFFLVMQSVFTVASLSQIVDAGLHDPVGNWWATVLMYLFSLLTIVLAFKIYRQKMTR